MSYASSWDFTMANYDAVWGFLVQEGQFRYSKSVCQTHIATLRRGC